MVTLVMLVTLVRVGSCRSPRQGATGRRPLPRVLGNNSPPCLEDDLTRGYGDNITSLVGGDWALLYLPHDCKAIG
jgi:hypothetical protein